MHTGRLVPSAVVRAAGPCRPPPPASPGPPSPSFSQTPWGPPDGPQRLPRLPQVPIHALWSDGRENLLGALLMAGQYVIPEVAPHPGTWWVGPGPGAGVWRGVPVCSWGPRVQPSGGTCR